METAIVVLVLIILLALVGGIGYFFVRETGVENAREWLTSPGAIRKFMSPSRDQGSSGTRIASMPDNAAMPTAGESALPMAWDDAAFRDFQEEFRAELMRATGTTRDFDDRLTRMEGDLIASKALPGDVDTRLKDHEARINDRLGALRQQLRNARAADSPYAVKRADALAELYTNLAQVDNALANVVDPMLLPGEVLTVPREFFPDTLEWDNWNDVGERAYAFGESFNTARILLAPELAGHVEAFITALRQALTTNIYPTVQSDHPTPAHLERMRDGLTNIVERIPHLRRELESAYREASVSAATIDDDTRA